MARFLTASVDGLIAGSKRKINQRTSTFLHHALHRCIAACTGGELLGERHSADEASVVSLCPCSKISSKDTDAGGQQHRSAELGLEAVEEASIL
mmetsp:Transcript_34433/g.79986  ORF Transcript_34433/g.79986 Transcript_34433/m.79986 type:complete len:94 (-) Transcript_34433:1454-1735(-)